MYGWLVCVVGTVLLCMAAGAGSRGDGKGVLALSSAFVLLAISLAALIPFPAAVAERFVFHPDVLFVVLPPLAGAGAALGAALGNALHRQWRAMLLGSLTSLVLVALTWLICLAI